MHSMLTRDDKPSSLHALGADEAKVNDDHYRRETCHWSGTENSSTTPTLSINQSHLYFVSFCKQVILTSCAGGRHNMSRPLQVDLWPFDLESGVRVTCDVGCLCANFSLPMPLCSRIRLDVRDRQIDVRQTDVRRASSL